MNIKIAKVIDRYTLVLNKGEKDGIKVGQRFLIYSIGDEIIDPDTKESLGNLEIVKGTGRVTNLQDKMATIGSDMKSSPSRTVRRVKEGDPLGIRAITRAFGGSTTQEIEEQLPPEKIPFEDPTIGDMAKTI